MKSIAAVLTCLTALFVLHRSLDARIEEFLLTDIQIKRLEFRLLEARIDYMMSNPRGFNNVSFFYDAEGGYREEVGLQSPTKGKLVIYLIDERKKWPVSDRTGLPAALKEALETVHSFVRLYVPDLRNDVACVFYSKEGTKLAWYENGKYRLNSEIFGPGEKKERWLPR